MLKVVIIKENSCYKVGDTAFVLGGSLSRNTVNVMAKTGYEKEFIDLVIGEDAIFLNTGCNQKDSPDFREMLLSMYESIELASGSTATISQKLVNISLLDFMKSMAPNGIRFKHVKKVDCDGDNMPDLFRKNDTIY